MTNDPSASPDSTSSPSPAAANNTSGALPSASGLRTTTRGAVKVVLVTSVMLTFISFWRAAAVVLCDLASTAYYIGGIVEQAIGEAAPWFILAVMFFALMVRFVYVEACSMFVRGGVYRIVKEAMGIGIAKVAVSALVFDYVLTGPISSVSAGHYVHSLCEEMFQLFAGAQAKLPIPSDPFSVIVALGITFYFWRLNIRGIEESSHKALRIMQITAFMVICIVVWTLYTLWVRPTLDWPEFKVELNPANREHTLGWLSGIPGIEIMTWALVVVGFGHSLLAMSGEETLAQVYREIEAPKHRNLMRAAVVIFIFSITMTGFFAFAGVMIIPDELRSNYFDKMLTGTIQYLEGPGILKIIMTAFVVGVGALILSGAVNTSMIGANGVLNRVAEDGILHDWFRHPHSKFGTTHRIINMIAIFQGVTIIASMGNIYLLGEAYAFGVVWSFTFMGLSMLVLRYRYKGEREWKMPPNIRLGKVEIPIGLGITVAILVMVAVTNLFTKKIATISGVAFTAGFFILFVISERVTQAKLRKAREAAGLTDADAEEGHREKFLLEEHADISTEVLELPEERPRILVPVRDPSNLSHLTKVLEEALPRGMEVVVMTIKVERGERTFQHLFTKDEELLFTRVIEIAEKFGENLAPIVVPATDSWFAIANTAYEIGATEVALGRSGRIPADVLLEQLTVNWMLVSGGEKPLAVRIIGPDDETNVTI